MPLPDNMELQTPQAKEWPLIPADVYQAEITDIEYKEIDNRWKQHPTDPDKKQIMNFEFTIIEEGQHYGRKLWQKMSPVKPYPPKQPGKESWVYRIASAMAGHAISKGEADKYTTSDINGFIHRQIRMTVSESAPNENGKRYNNIDSFLTIKQQLPIFDEAKVPKTNLPEATPQSVTPAPEPVAQSEQPQTPQSQSGHEKARAVANSLAGGNVAPQGDIETSSAYEDIDLDQVPFN